MRKHKKGISPLIATVLLLGFTVALAAVIMTWGLDYIKSTTEKTGETTDKALMCTNELGFEITFDCEHDEMIVFNEGTIDITSLDVIASLTTGDSKTAKLEEGIPVFNERVYPSSDLDFTLEDVEEIRVRATVKTDKGVDIVCDVQTKKKENPCPPPPASI